MSRAERRHLELLVELARMRAMREVAGPEDEDSINEQLEEAWFQLTPAERATVNEQIGEIVAAKLSREDEYHAMLRLLTAEPVETDVPLWRAPRVHLSESSLR